MRPSAFWGEVFADLHRRVALKLFKAHGSAHTHLCTHRWLRRSAMADRGSRETCRCCSAAAVRYYTHTQYWWLGALPWLPLEQLPGRARWAAWGSLQAVLQLHANETRRQVGKG